MLRVEVVVLCSLMADGMKKLAAFLSSSSPSRTPCGPVSPPPQSWLSSPICSDRWHHCSRFHLPSTLLQRIRHWLKQSGRTFVAVVELKNRFSLSTHSLVPSAVMLGSFHACDGFHPCPHLSRVLLLQLFLYPVLVAGFSPPHPPLSLWWWVVS